jgi:hypothetical protein
MLEMTAGERWARDPLLELHRGGYAPAAWWRFFEASRTRARNDDGTPRQGETGTRLVRVRWDRQPSHRVHSGIRPGEHRQAASVLAADVGVRGLPAGEFAG